MCKRNSKVGQGNSEHGVIWNNFFRLLFALVINLLSRLKDYEVQALSMPDKHGKL